ncbi:hypothetical protein CAP48_07260 [Advenella sp. S44]|uniref:hypothetical protein n=1 Tax=Advenella sp. S44 TaxID=1982755 RepID=UPI000C2AC50A|nr:hypothetical protein [Advenella sp. S44]PJX25827.1 hypothetical protein CAP48_07260 [Advenella sp. S44]
MRKPLLLLVGACTLLAACAAPPVVAPLSDAQLEAMSCRQIGRESDKLNLQVDQLRGNNAVFGPPEDQKRAAITAAQHRLQQLRTQSVKKLCTFG